MLPTASRLPFVLTHSDYLQRRFARLPGLAEATAAGLEQPFTREAIAAGLVAHLASATPTVGTPATPDALGITASPAVLPASAPEMSEAALRRALRQMRHTVMARVIARDLLGLANLDEVVRTVSDLAELSIATAQAWACQRDARTGGPVGRESGTPQALIVVGMGKLGGGELNVSSDIDLIFLYPEEGETDGPRRISNHEWFARAGKKLIALLDEPDEDGFVFRVDMRLRPFGESGPLVASFATLEQYLLAHGREWERYAWIKGRALPVDADAILDAALHTYCGAVSAASAEQLRQLEQLVTPFVYRKYLDYGAYASMRDLHGQIQREVLLRDRADDIKLGPGGIREIEFIAQVFQLIRGGRQPVLRNRSTRAVLALLAEQGAMSSESVAELRAAYAFLRNLEHRLQYIDDAQTQRLPLEEKDRHRIAYSMGYPGAEGRDKGREGKGVDEISPRGDWNAFCAALNAHRAVVSRHFEQRFSLPQAEGDAVHPLTGVWLGITDGQPGQDRLRQLGYTDDAAVEQQLTQLANGRAYQKLADKNRRRIDTLLPPLLEVCASKQNPDATLTRVLRFLESIVRRETYLALLVEHPQTLSRLVDLHANSPWVADYLRQYPSLLDELLDARALRETPDWPTWQARLYAELQQHASDVEAQLDLLRHSQHQQIFRLCLQDLAGRYPLTTLSDHLSALADAILACVLACAWASLPRRHCETPQVAIIGYGKLGGKELGYGSDLDIVLIHQDPHPDASEHYTRLAWRINHWLSDPTAAGTLYEVDMRLRPNGSKGLLVSSLEGFEQYQKHEAWVWEHQAITRARFVAGDAAIGQGFEAVREAVLMQVRDLPQLAHDVRQMREKMRATHPAHPEDIKHCLGGLVDVEFIVQYLVLAHGHRHADLRRDLGVIALLDIAAREQLIPRGLAEQVRETYRSLRQLQHQERLDPQSLDAFELDAVAPGCEAVRQLWMLTLNPTAASA